MPLKKLFWKCWVSTIPLTGSSVWTNNLLIYLSSFKTQRSHFGREETKGYLGQSLYCCIFECHCFLWLCRCENCQQISCQHCCDYSMISVQVSATPYTSSKLREACLCGEDFRIWYSSCCFICQLNLTIQMLKAMWLLVLSLEMAVLPPLPLLLRSRGWQVFHWWPYLLCCLPCFR